MVVNYLAVDMGDAPFKVELPSREPEREEPLPPREPEVEEPLSREPEGEDPPPSREPEGEPLPSPREGEPLPLPREGEPERPQPKRRESVRPQPKREESVRPQPKREESEGEELQSQEPEGELLPSREPEGEPLPSPREGEPLSREPEGEPLPSREPEGEEPPSREPEGEPLTSREPEGDPLPSREPEGEPLQSPREGELLQSPREGEPLQSPREGEPLPSPREREPLPSPREGEPECPQPEREEPERPQPKRKEPEQVVGALDAQKIVAVSCGKAHTLAVSEQGQVFSWGAGSDGQLGLGTTEEVVKVPRLIKKLCEHRITQVMCGSQHCIALSRDGQLFTWGQNTNGQLGLGKGEPSKPSPQPLKSLSGIPLAQIAAGGDHSFAVSLSGAVFGWGRNHAGQLGLNDEQEVVGALDAQKIVAVSCGKAHTLAVSEQGQVFSWGAGSDGQLGLGTTEEVVKVPRLIKKLCEHRITQVMCGSQHCIALSRDGQLFTWGQNTNGQLGLGKGEPSKPSPQPLKSLSGIPLAQIAAGGDHSFAVSLSGAVFGWGRNHAGQLGLNDEQDRAVPCHIKSLRSQKVVYISCGEEHTAALTKDGGLFTFGAGSHGQLGHDSTNNEFLPRRVLELMGSEVTQIACGRQHTLVFVPSSGLVYAFGCNSKGQLGNGCVGIAKSPQPVKGSLVAHKGQLSPLPDRSEQYAIRRIHCGGDHNFLMCSKFENSVTPEDFRIIHCTKSISVINNDNLNLWRQKLMENIDSSAVNNDGHFKTNPKIPGIDLNSVRLLFKTLMKPPYSRLLEQATKSFESLLIPQLSCSPPDVEAMRIYLILYECPVLNDSKYYITLTVPLAMAILRLDTNPSKVLDNWWSSVDSGVFTRLVEMYKRIVVFLLSGGKTLLIPVFLDSYISAALKLLEKLHKVNLKAQHVEYDQFYIPGLTSLVDIQEDYLKWFLNMAENNSVTLCAYPFIFNAPAKTKMLQTDAELQMQIARENYGLTEVKELVPGGENITVKKSNRKEGCSSASMDKNQNSVTLCAYPFIFNAPAKTKMLQTDAELQMQIAVNGANLHNVFMLLTLEPMLARNPFLVLHVRRVSLVSDTLRELSICSDVDLKKPLKVIFDGEEAVDAGGLTKEFFLLLLKELLDPVYGMFTQYKESNLLWFSDKCFVEHNWFHLIGITCGLAIYNSTVVDLQFPLALYKKLLGVPPTLVDLKELSPTEGRQEFVEAYLNYVFNKSIEELYLAFSSGFLKVCGGKVLSLFQPSELMAMVVGNNNYNWDEMEKNAVYKGEYSASHPTVKIFWEVFHGFQLEKKKQFLLFLTGSDRIPIYGMESLQIVIQPTSAGEQYLPVAHTCYNLLDLPKYQTKEILRRRLTQAIEQYEGFSLV
ncbi:UNVERIFIED_CONTAM: hypothetical protein FKN15_061376 [Acipenser sinensis]